MATQPVPRPPHRARAASEAARAAERLKLPETPVMPDFGNVSGEVKILGDALPIAAQIEAGMKLTTKWTNESAGQFPVAEGPLSCHQGGNVGNSRKSRRGKDLKQESINFWRRGVAT